jgi:hypothetical protein
VATGPALGSIDSDGLSGGSAPGTVGDVRASGDVVGGPETGVV